MDIEIPSTDGVTLQATLAGNWDRTDKIVLFVHGITSPSRDESYGYFKRLAEKFAESGVASLRFDARLHGKTTAPKDLTFTLRGLRDDIAAARAAIGERAPAAAVSLFGLSMGGLGALSAPGDLPYDKIILSAPVLDGWHVFGRDPAMVQAARAGRTVDLYGVPIADAFFNEMASANVVNVLRYLRQHTLPVLLIHGTKDNVCPAKYVKSLLRSGGPQVTPLEMPGMGHLYPMADDEEDYNLWPRRPGSERNLATIAARSLAFLNGK